MTEILKFKLEGYNPRDQSDRQLADDWRLAVAKFSTMRDGGKTEFDSMPQVERFAATLLEEILRRGRITFHPQKSSPAGRDLLRKTLTETVVRGVYLTAPHGEFIWDGRKTSLLKSRPFDRLEDMHILVSGKLAYGFLRCKEGDAVSTEAVKKGEGFDRHRVSREEVEKWWPRKKTLYEYPVRDFVPFERPRPVQVEQGVQTFIERVRFAKAHRADEPITLIRDFVSLVGSAAYGQNDGLQDLDVVIRFDDGTPLSKSLVESTMIRVRQRFDPDKDEGGPHFLLNATGPHDDYLPLYDLVLVPRKADVVKAQKLRVDLGCGRAKPAGYIGIDVDPRAEADIPWDLEQGIPFADNSVDEFRAHHILEHLTIPPVTMYQIWSRLKPDGILDFEVPSTKGEGAFAHPGHRSFWNKAAFSFYCDENLREEIGFPGLFQVVEMEEEKRGDAVYLRGRLRAIKPEPVRKAGVAPFGGYTPPKPTMAGRTDAFSTDEIWPWTEKRLPVAVEEKLNGLRMLAEKAGDRFRIKTEGNKDLTAALPTLARLLQEKAGANFVLDCSLWIERNGRPLPRKALMTLLSRKPDLAEGDVVRAIAFDLPFDGEDISGRPLSERRKRLEKFMKGLDKKHFGITTHTVVKDRKALDAQFRKLANLPGSEGMMVKALDSTWPAGGRADGWAKIKVELELKVEVISVQKTKGGAYNYEIGLKQDKGGGLISLGKTFSTKVRAGEGDVLTVTVQELIPDPEDPSKLDMLGATVVDRDPDRGSPYTARQALDMAARRGGAVLQKKDEPPLEEETQGTPRGEGNRHERAVANWAKNWHRMFPPSGKGRFVYQHHWRGLTEEESKADEKELLKTGNSVHGDLRCTYSKGFSWGFTVFLGEAADVAGGRDVGALPPDDKLQGTFKLDVPNEWQTVAHHAPYVGEPGSVGATSKGWTKLFEEDLGAYQMGVWREHAMEIFFSGKRIKGRYIIQYAPVGDGGKRVWLISKPKDQKPYADSHDREKVIAELKSKGQRFLVWAKPGRKPELIEVSDTEKEKVEKVWKVPIHKSDDERRIVYGVVLEPDVEDGQGDVYDADAVERAAYGYMLRSQEMDVMHAFDPGGIRVVESYIAKTNETWEYNGAKAKVRKGSWVIGAYVADEQTWHDVKAGRLDGFSIEGAANVQFEPGEEAA